MCRYAEVVNAPPVVPQNQENIRDLKADRRHREKVYRYHVLHMILKERPPSLLDGDYPMVFSKHRNLFRKRGTDRLSPPCTKTSGRPCP